MEHDTRIFPFTPHHGWTYTIQRLVEKKTLEKRKRQDLVVTTKKTAITHGDGWVDYGLFSTS